MLNVRHDSLLSLTTLTYLLGVIYPLKIAKFQQIIGTIKSTILKVRPETILKFYKVMAIPLLRYGSETWTLTSNQLRRIEAAEMKLLRPLVGYTLYDHKRNADIRTKLNMAPILDTFWERRGRVDNCSASHPGGRGSIPGRSGVGFLSGDTAIGVFLGVLPFPQFTPIPSSYQLTPFIILTPSVMSQAAGTNKKKWLKVVIVSCTHWV
ncbi:hypothetical protein C0J52_24508 [Blattella germanica]|nr:hypothetical protein C0J52_24508 [Blattella germanica]